MVVGHESRQDHVGEPHGHEDDAREDLEDCCASQLRLAEEAHVPVWWCGVVCGGVVVWCVVVWCGVWWCGGVVWWCGVWWCSVVMCGVGMCGVVRCGVVW